MERADPYSDEESEESDISIRSGRESVSSPGKEVTFVDSMSTSSKLLVRGTRRDCCDAEELFIS
jgi:hypothetical protein